MPDKFGGSTKPLGIKSYGSIPHLPESRMGPADHSCHEGQARIATQQVRDKHDVVIVQEKLDGSCVSIAKVNGEIVALGRAGYLAQTSPFEQHHLFAAWVRAERILWDSILSEGERIVGEWLAQAHGTRYNLNGKDPFVPFDIMMGKERATVEEVESRLGNLFVLPATLNDGEPMSVLDALAALGTYGHHGALDRVEGAVWRVERKGKVDFLVKYVRPDKKDGIYLPEVSGQPAVWNWRPMSRT